MRKKPYTQTGIRRLECCREGCTNKAEHQWNICADGGQKRPICLDCDVEINRLVMEFMFPSEAKEKIDAYKRKTYGNE